MFNSNIKDRQSASKKAWRKRRLIAIASMLLLLAVGLIWLVPNKPERLLQGKPESWWVNGLLGHATNSAPWASLGTNGVQLLIKTLETKGGPFHNAYAKIWPGLPALLRDRLPRPIQLAPFRFEAATTLAEMGPEAKIAVPALVRALDDDDSGVRMNAANSLGFLGKDDKAIMRFFPQALLNTNKWVRGNIVSALGSCQRSAESTAMLIKAMTDPEPGIRTSATTILLIKDPQAAVNAGAVSLLLRSYSGNNKEAADDARIALSNLPPGAVPILEKALQDPDPEISAAANKIIKLRQPQATNKPVIK